MNCYTDYWKRYCDFKGRSTRTEFFVPTIINNVVNGLISLVIMLTCGLIPSIVYGVIFFVVTFLPTSGLGGRRFNDAGISNWNWFWLLCPIVGCINLIFYICQPSKD